MVPEKKHYLCDVRTGAGRLGFKKSNLEREIQSTRATARLYENGSKS